MKKLYERFVITSQIRAADEATECPIEIVPNETYVKYRMKKEENKVKEDLVNEIVNILALEFGR